MRIKIILYLATIQSCQNTQTGFEPLDYSDVLTLGVLLYSERCPDTLGCQRTKHNWEIKLAAHPGYRV